jgi:ClpA/ClpB-like protein
MLVLVRALLLAQESGASEIGIDHLLAAFTPETGSAAPRDAPFFPVPKREMSLSPDAAAAIVHLGEISTIPSDVLLAALLSAKRRGAN